MFEDVTIPKDAEHGVFVFFKDERLEAYRFVSRVTHDKSIDILTIPFQSGLEEPDEEKAAEALAETIYRVYDLGDSGPCDYEYFKTLNDFAKNGNSISMELVRKHLNKIRSYE